MAPIKRARNAVDPNETQAATRKRPRVSGALAGSDDSDSDSTDDASVAPSGAGDYDDSDGDEEDAIERRQTQAIREKFMSNEENVPMEHGIIERVDCYNFMCHEHFYVDLGPLINFIVGKNGSGKSAILTAITLCLGGKASVTNRGQSLKNFIKEGKESATIIVRLKNQGDGAYMPDEYGRSIIVERHFSKSGTSGFRLKSASGRVVSTRKSDLDLITDYYALQIDNPMNVLSQDMARQFIGVSTPAEKYKFFVKGVQLEQLDQDYRILEDYIDQIEGKLEFQRDEMKNLKTARDRTAARLALSDRQEGLRDRIRKLRGQMVWAQVEDQERIRDACSEEVAKTTENITHLEAEVETIDRSFQEADREHESAKQVTQNARESLAEHSEGKTSVQEKYDEAVKERHDLQAQQRSISQHLKAAEKQIQDSRKKIDEETQRLADLDGGSNAHKIAELEEKKAASEQMKSRYLDHKRDRDRLQDDINRAEASIRATHSPISAKQNELQQAQNRLQNLSRDRGKQQSGFHERMPMLLRAIQQDNSFSRQPIGPLGNHMRLLKPQWSSVLESTFGATLTSFVVTSKQDMNILSNIMQKVNCSCPILIGNDAGNIDTSAHEPDSRFDTALRVLEIDNDIVRKQLVINHGVEQMLLIEDLEEASSTLFDGERPRNVKRCYCIDKRDKRRGIHLSYNRQGEPSQSPVRAYTGQPRMKTDIESQIRMQQEVVDSLDKELQGLVQQRRQAESHLVTCQRSFTDHGHQEQQLQFESQKAEDVVEEWKEEVERSSMDDSQLQVFKTNLEEAEEEKRLNAASYEDGVNAMDELVEKLKVIKRELAAKGSEMAAVEQNVRGLEEEEARLSKKRVKALGEKNVAIGRVGEAKKDKLAAEKKKEEISEKVHDFIEKANIVSPRVSIDAGETAFTLDKKLAKLHGDLDRYEREMGASREEIAAAATAANQKYKSSERQIKEFENTASTLRQTLMERQERWKQFRNHISGRARLQFTYLLSERSYRGKLLTDHASKLLELQVEPDITKDNSGGRGAKTLSGGERSFSQICLLLALWEAMGSPIRCLDEFDVYMDSVNRTMTIDMLMSAARRSVGRQFLFITPGSRSDIRLAPDVRVKELAEPERGQQTLPFTS